MVTCPADGRTVAHMPAATVEDIGALAQRLRNAQLEWEQMGASARAQWLGRWRDWVLDHRSELPTLVQRESGRRDIRPHVACCARA